MIKGKFIIFIVLFFSSCSSYEQFRYIAEEFETPSQVFKATYNQAWQAVLQFMKNLDLESSNIESGVIKTRWITNTLELNFTDSFGDKDTIKAAQYKVIVNVSKGFQGSVEVTKVTIFKRQMVEQDFLQGWKIIPSDGIFEQTALYRIERILRIDNKMKLIEEKKSKEAESQI